MDPSIFDNLPPAPNSTAQSPAPTDDVNALLAQATQMANQGGPGANAEAAQKWLQEQLAARGNIPTKQQPSNSIFSAVPDTGTVQVKAPIKMTGAEPDTTGQRIIQSLAQGYKTAVIDPYNYLQSHIYNYLTHPENLATQQPGQVTPQQKKAAKLLGVNLGNKWGAINKVSPEEARQQSNAAMAMFGLNPQEVAKRAAEVQSGQEYSGPIEGVVQHSAISDLLSDVYNPNKSDTTLYYKVNEIAHLQNIAEHPDQYPKDQVNTANEILNAYREHAKKGSWQTFKEGVSEMAKHPVSLINALVADPELLAAPEAKIFGETLGTRATEAAAESAKAARTAALAGKVGEAAGAMPTVERAAGEVAAEQGAKAAQSASAAKALAKGQKLADITSGAVSGAGINAAISAEQQHHEQGFINPHEVGGAGLTGAAMGSIFAGLEGGPSISKELAGEVPKIRAPLEPVLPKDQTGTVDRRLLATGAAAGLGATAAATAAPEGKKRVAALAGGLAGLFGGMTMWGGDIPRRGMGRQEGMFAGPKSETYNWDAVKQAQKLEESGASPEQIHVLTNYHRVGNNWVHEFSDHGVDLPNLESNDFLSRRIRSQTGVPASAIIQHSEFNKAYPDLLDKIRIKIDPTLQGLGEYRPTSRTIILQTPSYLERFAHLGESFKEVLIHELQHAVQHYEGLPRGSTIGREKAKLLEQLTNAQDTLEYLKQKQKKAYEEGMPNMALSVRDRIRSTMDVINKLGSEEKLNREANKNYRRSTGEVQSVSTQQRLKLSEQERRNLPPMDWWDYSANKQITEAQKLPWEATEPKQTSAWPTEEPTSMHEAPISDHLKKTGEMDEEGKLSGMVLPEDHLPNEAAVLEKAKSGDQQAITRLYKQYMPRLTRSMQNMMRQAGPRLGMDAEDIAQEAFMKATQNLDSFQGNSAFYTWLHSIARNTALNAIERSGRQIKTKSIFAELPGSGDPLSGGIEARGSALTPEAERAAAETDTPEGTFVAQQTSNMVRHAISKLPNDIKEAIKMKEMEGLSEQEIAAKQNVPLGTVKSRLFRGRNMIADSIKKGHGARYRNQSGFATPEALKKLAKIALLGGGGATLGAYYAEPGHKGLGAFQGAALGLVAGEVNWRNLVPAAKEAFSKQPWYNVNDLLNNWDTARARAERFASQTQYHIDKLAPSKESQTKITHFLDGQTDIPLTDREYEAAKVARKFYDAVGKQGLETGVLKDFLQNYINHEWGDTTKAKQFEEKVLSSISTNMSPKDRHALARKFMTIEAGKKFGLVPKTENVNDLISIYSRSMSRAIANKNLLDGLKARTLDSAEKVKAMMGARNAPVNYVPINHPQLHGYRVHPSIAPSLDFLFHTYKQGPLADAVFGLNTAIKRMEVSISLFHPKALIDAYFGAMPGTNFLQNLANVGLSMVGKTEFHKQYLSGGSGGIVDLGLQGGLKIDPRKGQISDEDLKTNFYEALERTGQFLDKMIPGAQKLPQGVAKINKGFDKFTWENVHTGLKGTVFMNACERISRSWAKAAEKDPNVQIPNKLEIAQMGRSHGRED